MTKFLTIWTTDKESAEGVANTITIADARLASLGWLAIGILLGPLVHRKTGMAPLV